MISRYKRFFQPSTLGALLEELIFHRMVKLLTRYTRIIAELLAASTAISDEGANNLSNYYKSKQIQSILKYKINTKSSTTLIILAVMAISLSACYEPVEGCLDPLATNFDLDADEGCPDCCTYPTFKLRFEHIWSYPDTTVSLRFDTFYLDNSGQTFLIENIQYYWSEAFLVDAAGAPILTTDSITAGIVENPGDTVSQNILDNFALIEASTSNSTHTIGTITPEGSIAGFQVNFGVSQPANSAWEGSFLNSHPLGPQIISMNQGTETGYIFARIELDLDTSVTDTVPLVLHISGDDMLMPLSFNLDPPAMLFEGLAPTLVISANYQNWFGNVDITIPDTTALKQQIVQNITQSFQVTALENN